MSSQQMPNWLTKRAELTPDRIALKWNGEEVTFAELQKAAIQRAMQLSSIGVASDDHVALLLQNDIETVVIIHALTYLGAVAVMLNNRLTAHELAWQMTDAEASLLIYDLTNEEKAVSIRAHETQHIKGYSCKEIISLPERECLLRDEIDLDEIHTIIYTSGTTGHPKGVMLSYGNHWWSAIGSALNLGLAVEDCWLAVVPFFHVSGLSILMKSVIYGMSVLIYDHFDPNEINRAIIQERVSHISVVSNTLARLLEDMGKRANPKYPPTFRCMLVGGGPVPLHLLEQCKELKIPVYQTYGLTETASQIVTLAPEYMLTKLGSAGKPLFYADLRIVKDEVDAKPYDIGEIVVKGFNVTRGYFRREEATVQAIHDGWLHTGDMGYLDADGFLYVVDRRSDLIISGGENIYPAEIESVLTSHPAIEEAGVTGQAHQEWGQIPIGFVKIREGYSVDKDEILLYCRERLAKYKIPHTLYFVDHIPRNAGNKILRRKLRELLILFQ